MKNCHSKWNKRKGDKGQFKSWNKAYNFKHILFLYLFKVLYKKIYLERIQSSCTALNCKLVKEHCLKKSDRYSEGTVIKTHPPLAKASGGARH